MYYYIYDEFVQDKKYERELISVENRLADLGIAGRVARLALFKHADSLIVDELERGTITTVVVVGNDGTVHKVLDAIAGFDVAFGIVPIGAENTFAKILGIPNGVTAVDVLSARNLEKIDTGRLNGHRFVTGVVFPKMMAKVACDGQFTMTTERAGVIKIRNLICGEINKEEVGNPTDGLLETVITVGSGRLSFGRKQGGKESIVGSKEIEIDFPEEVVALADGKEVKGSSFSIEVEPMAISVITGRDRMF